MQEDLTARLRKSYSYEIIGKDRESDFDRITEMATLICESKISLISFSDGTKHWCKAVKGFNNKELKAVLPLCNYPLAATGALIIRDILDDERFKEHPAIGSGEEIRFYAAYPLTDNNGTVLGSLSVMDTVPKKITSTQQKLLSLLVEEISSLIQERVKKIEDKNIGLLFEHSDDLICILDKDLKFKRMNTSFDIKLGWTGQELRQKNIARYCSGSRTRTS